MDRQAMRERLERDGYLLLEDVLDPAADLQPLVEDYAARLDRLAGEWDSRGVDQFAL